MLKCIPYQVPRNVEVGKTVTIRFGVQNLYNQPVDVVIFLAHCGNDSQCRNFTVIWKSGLVTINPKQTLSVTLNITFKHDGYFGIGVYNHMLRKLECGFIVHVTQPNPILSFFGNLGALIQMLLFMPILSIFISMINSLLSSIGGGK